MGKLRPGEVLGRDDSSRDEGDVSIQEVVRQYMQMSLGMALDGAVGEGRRQAGFCQAAG